MLHRIQSDIVIFFPSVFVIFLFFFSCFSFPIVLSINSLKQIARGGKKRGKQPVRSVVGKRSGRSEKKEKFFFSYKSGGKEEDWFGMENFS